MCIVYNYCFMIFDRDESKYEFKETKFILNFKDMTEIINGQLRMIRRQDDSIMR